MKIIPNMKGLASICAKFSNSYDCQCQPGFTGNLCQTGRIIRLNHTSWVIAVTPTDRPKSVRNSCLIKVFGGVFKLSRWFFWIILWV